MYLNQIALTKSTNINQEEQGTRSVEDFCYLAL